MDVGTHTGLKHRQSHGTHLRSEQRKHFTSAKTAGKQDAGLVTEPPERRERHSSLCPPPTWQRSRAVPQGNLAPSPAERALLRQSEGLVQQPGGFEELCGSACGRGAPAGIASRAAREKRRFPPSGTAACRDQRGCVTSLCGTAPACWDTGRRGAGEGRGCPGGHSAGQSPGRAPVCPGVTQPAPGATRAHGKGALAGHRELSAEPGRQPVLLQRNQDNSA